MNITPLYNLSIDIQIQEIERIELKIRKHPLALKSADKICKALFSCEGQQQKLLHENNKN